MSRELHVLDTCVWINSLDKHRQMLADLIELVRYGLIDLAVPSIVAEDGATTWSSS